VKAKRTSEFENSSPTRTYYLRSSVLGREAAEVASDGAEATGYVYAGDELVATVANGWAVFYQHRDASGRSKLTTAQSGTPLVEGRDETDPLGATVQRLNEQPRYRAGTGGVPKASWAGRRRRASRA
jgi:hypothetical protein